jgi:hypothetical protein
MKTPKLPRGVKFEVQKIDFGRGIAIFAFTEKGALTTVGTDVVEQEVEVGAECPPLMLLHGLDLPALQSLADALFTMGVMPKTADHVKELEATRAHLADMRAMAMKGFDTMIAQQYISGKATT